MLLHKKTLSDQCFNAFSMYRTLKTRLEEAEEEADEACCGKWHLRDDSDGVLRAVQDAKKLTHIGERNS